MKELIQRATAGTLESSDIYVEVEPVEAGAGLDLVVGSVVYAQFGQEIEKVIRDTLAELGVTDAKVRVSDRGAVDCTIRARVEAAVRRGSNGGSADQDGAEKKGAMQS